MKKIKKLVFVLLTISTALMAAFVGYDRLQRDTLAPVITVPEAVMEAPISVTQEELLAEITAVDDRDGEVTAVVEKISPVTQERQCTITYAAADTAGNVSRAERTLHYTDYQPPRFQMTAAPRAASDNGIYTALSGIRAYDGTGKDLTSRIRFDTLDNKMAYDLGDHMLELRVTDSFGFNAILEVPVELFDGAKERIGVTLSEYLLYLPLNSTFDPQSYFVESTVSGTLTVESDVKTDEPGVYPVEYTVTGDTEDMIGRSRMIVVVEP